ncbi:uncharacterized protein TEOVI_000062000 [Trypanosoma equiperdum]|uniref:Uncharacterized protein n=2 Tax=Trypanozoon TaxID=39700 RepID=Q57VA4_TRYB2|nr:hypothetical protein, conserved [Trypanosoma brucei brucei TREU927]AAX70430.1 hypothetical protein, conserved [Trypanosoma brucei]AAZ11274.1 hypothetical protein, conserved [Trypanosoma brucei brucei TREU927]SCU69063.1 hypothetical protein, conserved [Trypanosoma equiperdum]
MVIKKDVPFKYTLHQGLCERDPVLSTPLIITAGVDGNELQYRLDMQVPSHSAIEGMEVTNVEFLFTSSKCNAGKSNQHLSKCSMLVYLYMQLLDGVGRPTSPPFPISCCNTHTGKGIFSCVKLPLQVNQQCRFYLVRRSCTDSASQSAMELKGVRFTSKLYLLYRSPLNSAKVRSQMDVLTGGDLKFTADTEVMTSTGAKRSREELERFGSENSDRKGKKAKRERETATTMDRASDDEPPNLIYAFVSGGDNES